MTTIPNFNGSNFVGGDYQNGFGIQFALQPDKSVKATYTFDKLKQGPPNIVHGGALSAVIDEAMTATVFANELPAFTVNLQINFQVPVNLGVETEIVGWIDRVEGKKIFLRAEIRFPDGTLAVKSEGLFIRSEELAKHFYP